jgi:hypothetical protein
MSNYPPYPPPPRAAPRKKAWPWIVGALVVLLIIGGVIAGQDKDNKPGRATGVSAGNDTPAGSTTSGGAVATGNHTVVYKVTGSSPASTITYTTDGMTTSNHESTVTLPWQKTITLPKGEALQFVSILAQGGTQSSKIDVEIIVDGAPFKQAHADGYGIAMANGNIGDMH